MNEIFSASHSRAVNPPIAPDATLHSTADTVLWGYIAANLAPALTIKSGQIVEIEALSHQGLTTHKDPENFFNAYGIPANEVLADAKSVYAEVKRPKGASVHILTGPIYVEGAEPGDTLEVRVLDIKFRVPYGVNNTGPGKGVLPKLLSILSWGSWLCRRRRAWAWSRRRRRAPGAATSISSSPASVRRCFCRFLTRAVNFLPATATPCKATARSTAARSRSRSSRRCNLSCTRKKHSSSRGSKPRRIISPPA